MDSFGRLSRNLEPRDVMAEVFAAIGYVPTERQSEFHAAGEYDVLFGGAAGGGKSCALVADDLKDAMRYPGIRIGAFRRSYDELSESLLKELARFGYGEALGARWNGSDRELRFANGSLIRYRYAETEVDASRRQGGEFQKLTLDERTLFAPGVVDRLAERVRSGNSAVPVIGIRSSTNPGGPGHGQVRARFIDATDYGAKVYRDGHDFEVRFIPAKVSDNPHVDKAYVRVLDAIPDPARRAAMKDGDWDQFSGQVFTEWSRERHVVPRFPLPASWARYAGIDWGFTAPWAVIWAAEDEDRRVWVYRERYATKVGELEQAHRITEAEQGETIAARYADDAMWTGRGDAKSVAAIYNEAGCFITPAHKGERISGWQRVHSYLGDGPACQHHRAQGWDVCPRLHVLDGTAPNLVRTLPTLPYDAHKPEDVDTHADDHVADSLRYLLINLGQRVSFVFDDEPGDADELHRYDTFTVRADPNIAHLNFDEDRDPMAGHAKPSPYV